MPDHIDNPAYGLYNQEYLDGPWAPPKPIHTDTGHPIIDGGKWCEQCRKEGIYSWLGITKTINRVDFYKTCSRKEEHKFSEVKK